MLFSILQAGLDRQSIAIRNALLSQRGSIRKAHDIFTWASKLRMLEVRGCDPSATMKKWQEIASKNGQITGGKRLALLNLLKLPEELVDDLIRHVSEFGFDGCCFSEDAFANKKILTGPCLHCISTCFHQPPKTKFLSQLMHQPILLLLNPINFESSIHQNQSPILLLLNPKEISYDLLLLFVFK